MRWVADATAASRLGGGHRQWHALASGSMGRKLCPDGADSALGLRRTTLWKGTRLEGTALSARNHRRTDYSSAWANQACEQAFHGEEPLSVGATTMGVQEERRARGRRRRERWARASCRRWRAASACSKSKPPATSRYARRPVDGSQGARCGRWMAATRHAGDPDPRPRKIRPEKQRPPLCALTGADDGR